MSLQQAGKLLFTPFKELGLAYGRAAAKRPFTVGVVTTGVKTSAADLFAQMARARSCHRSAAHGDQGESPVPLLVMLYIDPGKQT